jgi:hypothetical protein
VENSQPYLEIARWLKVEKLPTVRFDTIASFFDLPALSVPASHFRPGASLQAGAFEPGVCFLRIPRQCVEPR